MLPLLPLLPVAAIAAAAAAAATAAAPSVTTAAAALEVRIRPPDTRCAGYTPSCLIVTSKTRVSNFHHAQFLFTAPKNRDP